MNLLSIFIIFFNFWLCFKTSETIEYLVVKYYQLQGEVYSGGDYSDHRQQLQHQGSAWPFPLKSELIKGEIMLGENSRFLQVKYLFAISGISVIAIAISCLSLKKAKAIRKKNELLLLNNQLTRALNLDLQNTINLLEQTNAESDKVLQVIAHDLRSPMAAIVGLSSFMISDHDLSPEDLEVVSIIHTSGVDSLKFINGILEREVLDIGLRKETIDLQILLKYCTTQLQFKANEKGQKIVLKSTKIFLKINREKIWRVLTNLITNAIKFSPAASIITINLTCHDHKVVVAISDQGIGIPIELRDKIFSASAQLQREGTNGEKSFGIGLSIAKQNIEAHGGTLRFESEVNKGTTFFICLPMSAD
jgi:signal transduction histidine kinase